MLRNVERKRLNLGGTSVTKKLINGLGAHLDAFQRVLRRENKRNVFHRICSDQQAEPRKQERRGGRNL